MRTRKLDRHTRRLIARAVRDGVSIAKAARVAGVHRSTLGRWLAAGAGEVGPEAAALARAVAAIREARAQRWGA